MFDFQIVENSRGFTVSIYPTTKYAKTVNSKTFPSKAEAEAWGKKEVASFNAKSQK